MLADKIVLRDDRGEEITVPLKPSGAKRECGVDGKTCDCVLGGSVAVNAPIRIAILFRTDGSWDHWKTEFDGSGNTYLHVDQDQRVPITEAQRRTVARWRLKLDPSPYGMFLGASVCRWAFDGMTPDEVSARYGTGQKVFLTVPCNDREELVAACGNRDTLSDRRDLTPYHKGEDME